MNKYTENVTCWQNEYVIMSNFVQRVTEIFLMWQCVREAAKLFFWDVTPRSENSWILSTTLWKTSLCCKADNQIYFKARSRLWLLIITKSGYSLPVIIWNNLLVN